MKLLYVHNADFLYYSANRIQVLNMCKAFSKIVNITLMGFNCNKEVIKEKYGYDIDFEVVCLKPKGNYYLRSLQLFLNFLKIKDKFDYIFTRDLIFAFLVTKFLDKKVIYELHDEPHGYPWYFLFRLVFKNLKCCIVVSEGLKQELINKGFNKEKIYTLYNGVNLNKFNINISKDRAREILNLPKDKIIASYVGSLYMWKQYVKTFLDSFKYINNKNVLYLIVGGTEEQSTKLRKIYSNYENIKFIPYVSHSKVPLYLKASDILVISYTSNNIKMRNYLAPLKLFEYMASKRPIVASDLPSIRKIVSEDDVLFFRPDDERDLAEKIDLLIEDKDLQIKLSNNAFKKVQNYTWENRAKKIVEIFRE